EIWKMPSTGGPQVQITHSGGFHALEPAGSAFIYNVKQRGNTEIWKAPRDGGEEKLAVAYPDGRGAHVAMFAYLALAKDGLYFVEQEPTTGATRPSAQRFALRFFSFATGEIRTAMGLDRPPYLNTGGLAIAPDGRSALYTQLDRMDSDL